MDERVHARFLEYRDRFMYFAKETAVRQFSYEEFSAADAEQRSLEAKGDTRDDEEEERFGALTRVLFRD